MSTTAESGAIPSLGPLPGFTSRNTLFPSILATVLLCGILTTVFTAARLTTKRLISKFDVEDYFLMMAWVNIHITEAPKHMADFKEIFNSGYSLLILVAGLDGLGHHVWDTTAAELPEIPRLLQFTWALEIVYIPAIWLAKSSLLFQLIHIFTPMKSGPIYWACHTLIWGNLVFYLCILFLIIFECNPIHFVWDLFYEGHCINRNTVLVASGAVNVFSDLLNLLLPIWATWHLQMAPKRKAGVTAVFATGVLAFISSICRLIYAARIEHSADVSFIVVQIGLWALAELTSIILCTCFPMMPRLAKLISERRSKSKSYLTPPLGQAWKRKAAVASTDDSSSGTGGASSDATGETARFQRPYKHFGGAEDGMSGSSCGNSRIDDDVELAMSEFDTRDFSESLEQRLHMEFRVPNLSYS